jgi:hypothetical protein
MPVEAPDGTAAMTVYLSELISTSTVGFPLESRICRAWRAVIFAMKEKDKRTNLQSYLFYIKMELVRSLRPLGIVFFLFLLCVEGLFVAPILAQLRAESMVSITDGHIKSNSVLSDDEGRVFVEVVQDTYAVEKHRDLFYTGTLLAPEILPAPEGFLLPVMKEIVTFELYTADNVPIFFVDREKRVLNEVRILVSLVDPGQPSLWQYIPEEQTWTRLGGRVLENSPGEPSVFESSVYTTGIYGVFDEIPVLGGYELGPLKDDDVFYDDVFSDPRYPVLPPREELEQLYDRISTLEGILEAQRIQEQEMVDALAAQDALMFADEEGGLDAYEEGEIDGAAPGASVDVSAAEDVDALFLGDIGGALRDNVDESGVEATLDDELQALELESETSETSVIELAVEPIFEVPVQPLPDELPQTGASWLWIVMGLVLSSVVGFEVYERFFRRNI